MVPKGPGPLIVGVLECRVAFCPEDARFQQELRPEVIVLASSDRITGRDIIGIGQVPGFGKAVAFISRMRPMNVDDHGNRTSVRGRVDTVGVGLRPGRICTVQGLIDG